MVVQRIPKSPNSNPTLDSLNICLTSSTKRIWESLESFIDEWIKRNGTEGMHRFFKGSNLSTMSHDDVLISIDGQWPMTVLTVTFEAWHTVRCEQSSVLSHAQWLAFLAGRCSILRDRSPAIGQFVLFCFVFLFLFLLVLNLGQCSIKLYSGIWCFTKMQFILNLQTWLNFRSCEPGTSYPLWESKVDFFQSIDTLASQNLTTIFVVKLYWNISLILQYSRVS